MQTEKKRRTVAAILSGFSFAAYLPFGSIYIVLVLGMAIIQSPWESQFLSLLAQLHQAGGHPLVTWIGTMESYMFFCCLFIAFPATLLLCLEINVFINLRALGKPFKRIPALWMLVFGVVLPFIVYCILSTQLIRGVILSIPLFLLTTGAIGVGVCLLTDFIRCIRLLRKREDGS